MRLRFKHEGHSYTLDGAKIPALSNVLDFWFGEYVDHTAGVAADRGQRIHKACEYFSQGCLDWESLKTKDEDFTGYIKAFEKFFIDNPSIAKGKPTTEYKTFITLPEKIDYPEIKWTGCGMRIDLIFRQTSAIVEIKSGTPLNNHFWGYSREMMQLNTQIKGISSIRKPPEVWTGYILYIRKDGNYQAIKRKYDTNMWYHFLYAMTGWYNKNMEK
jgi:hypothetical protein